MADAAHDPDRDIVSTRVFPVPRAALFAAWLDPERLARWWGPAGFRNTFAVFEPRPGGAWRFTMHGPDGTDYANECVFVEIAEPERIVLDHVSPPRFRVTATFAEADGRTTLVFRQRFQDAATCAKVRPVCVPANEQNFDRLEAVLGLRR